MKTHAIILLLWLDQLKCKSSIRWIVIHCGWMSRGRSTRCLMLFKKRSSTRACLTVKYPCPNQSKVWLAYEKINWCVTSNLQYCTLFKQNSKFSKFCLQSPFQLSQYGFFGIEKQTCVASLRRNCVFCLKLVATVRKERGIKIQLEKNRIWQTIGQCGRMDALFFVF